jgi:hypothetical protein
MKSDHEKDEWVLVKYAHDFELCPDCGEPWCDECQAHYADCDHPGPDMHDEWEYTTFDGIDLARPRKLDVDYLL